LSTIFPKYLGTFCEALGSKANKGFEPIVLLQVEKASNKVVSKFDVFWLELLLDAVLHDCLLGMLLGFWERSLFKP
jgi:hypothetical protein